MKDSSKKSIQFIQVGDAKELNKIIDIFSKKDKLSSETPLQLVYVNETDEVKRVSVFEIFNNNQQGIKVTLPPYCNMEYLKKYYYEKPHVIESVRLQFSDMSQLENGFSIVNWIPTGIGCSMPVFMPLDYFNKNQFQDTIIDVPFYFVLDGITSDLEFNLLPNSSLALTMFFSMKFDTRNAKMLKSLREECALTYQKMNGGTSKSFIIENSSDIQKEITLLDVDKFEEYSQDKDLKISFVDVSDTKYTTFNQFVLPKHYYNNISIYAKSENQENNVKQVSKAIEFNDGNKYFPAINVNGTQFQTGMNEIGIKNTSLSLVNPFRVTVMPKTRVIYRFNNRQNEINELSKRFLNVDIENISDISKIQYDILSVNQDITILHTIDKNKSNILDLEINAVRILFYNKEQIEKPILFRFKDSNFTIYPVVYSNENKFLGNIVEFILPFKIKSNELEMLVDLSNKGDGMNVLLYDGDVGLVSCATEGFESTIQGYECKDVEVGSVRRLDPLDLYISPINKAIPLWLENTTDEPVTVELVNSISEYKGFPEGVKCNSDLGISYEEMLKKIEADKVYGTINLLKLYCKSISQLCKEFDIIDYTNGDFTEVDANGNSSTRKRIIGQSYLSAYQNQANIISFVDRLQGCGCKLLDIVSGLERKQKVSFLLLPKTKLCFILSVEVAKQIILNKEQ